MSFELSKASAPPTQRPFRPLKAQLEEWLALQMCKLQIRRERRDLAALPLHLLKDIGIDPVEAKRESERKLSDLPVSRILQMCTSQ